MTLFHVQPTFLPPRVQIIHKGREASREANSQYRLRTSSLSNIANDVSIFPISLLYSFHVFIKMHTTKSILIAVDIVGYVIVIKMHR